MPTSPGQIEQQPPVAATELDQQIEAVLPQDNTEALETLKGLPEHVVEHIGHVAVTMTHEDMHPKEVVEREDGRTSMKIDLEKVITDPTYDGMILGQEAKEAAEKGQQEVAELLSSGAKLIAEAHQQLAEKGHKFGSEQAETDEQKHSRETAEKNLIFSTAGSIAAQRSIEAKQSGNQEQCVKELESLVLVHSTGDLASRKDFREVVRAGLGRDLLQATEKTSHVFTGEDHQSVNNRSITACKDLLEYATGKSVGYDLKLQEDRDVSTSYRQLALDSESMLDMIAAATSEQCWLTPAVLKEYGSGSTLLNEVQNRINDESANTKIGLKDCYDIMEAIASNANQDEMSMLTQDTVNRDFVEIIKTDNPPEIAGLTSKLGISFQELQGFMLKSSEPNSRPYLETTSKEALMKVKAEFPDQFDQFMKFAHYSTQHSIPVKVNSARMLKGLEALKDKNMLDNEDILRITLEYSSVDVDPSVVIDKTTALEAASQKMGFKLDELFDDKMIVSAVFDQINEKDNPESIVAMQLVRNELQKLYKDAYDKLEFPISDRRKLYQQQQEAARSADLKYAKNIITRLGVPEEVASEMITSWLTYDEYTKAVYERLEKEPQLSEQFDGDKMQSILQNQIKAFESQAKALNEFNEQYGIENTQKIIEIFGIYNFSRHKSEALYDQLQRWEKGEPIQTVVVEARSDWNSFSGKPATFEEGVGEGVFYFEANSAYETSRIAVRSGQFERQNGRQPDVKRFIIHAHGSPEAMLIGVDGETIDTKSYLEAARKIEQIDSLENNDYKKHLGPNYEVILQSCSTAGEPTSDQNIAEMISEMHDTTVQASTNTIYTVTIKSDGTVSFRAKGDDGETVDDFQPTIYEN